MEKYQYLPTIKVNQLYLSKYLVIEIFATVFYQSELHSCFKMLSRNLNKLLLVESELIDKLAVKNHLN